jgi:hypothetical protein
MEETFSDIHAWGEQILVEEICEACVTFREKRNAKRVLVGRPEGKGPLEGWKDSIKIVFKK